MLTVICVLKSGGVYDASWVEKLYRGVNKNLTVEHQFGCISDVPVYKRIVPKNDWPGWWAKISLFEPGIIKGPTLYLDLDTVITGNIDAFTDLPYDFAMLENFNEPGMVGSGLMWFKEKAPTEVYERFCHAPQRTMDHYERMKRGSYRGDQAFIFDCLDRQVDKISSPALRSYKRHCRNGLPEGTSIVAFHGRPRPSEINADWLKANWI